MISAQILHENKTKWRVAPKRKTGAAAKHLLKQTADCTALQSQMTIEPWNHWTKNLKSLKNMVCCRLMRRSNNSETAVYGYNPALFWVVSVSCWCLAKWMFTWPDRYCCILLVEFKTSTCYLCWSGLYRSYFLQHVRLGSFAVLWG